MFVTTEIFLEILLLLGSNGSPLIRSIVSDFMTIYEKESQNDLHMGQNEHIKFYASLIKELLTTELSKRDFQIVLTKMRSLPIVKANREIYENVEKLLFPTEEITLEEKERHLRNVRNYLLWYYGQDYTRKMFGRLSAVNNTADNEKKENLLDEVKNIASQIGDKFYLIRSSKAAPTNIINFSDKESIARGIKKNRENKITGVFKTGWKGLNRMFGERGGIARGESICFCALSHHGKSTMLMNCARWIVNYNTPTMIPTPENPNPNVGKPTVLFISLENEASDNLMCMYRAVYESLTQNSGLDRPDEEIIEFIYEYFNRRGWTLLMERRIGSEFGFEELKAMYDDYSRNGYHILATLIDYLHKMKKSSTSNKDGGHTLLQTLYENCVNYITGKGSTFITAHQLNSVASTLASSGQNNVVKRFDFEHLEDGKAPFKVCDIIIFLHNEINTYGIKYLTLSIRKHRYVYTTKERHKHTAYRYTPYGIPDDLEGDDMSVKDIYADTFEMNPELTEQSDTIQVTSNFF